MAGPKFCLLPCCLMFIYSINQSVFSAYSVQGFSLQPDQRSCKPCCIFPFYHFSWASKRLLMYRMRHKHIACSVYLCSTTGIGKEFQKAHHGRHFKWKGLHPSLPCHVYPFTSTNACDSPNVRARESEPSLCWERHNVHGSWLADPHFLHQWASKWTLWFTLTEPWSLAHHSPWLTIELSVQEARLWVQFPSKRSLSSSCLHRTTHEGSS